jgi:hypothetical protein
VIRGGKLLTPEQTVRLAAASSADRQKLLKVIVDEMREQEAQPKPKPRRRPKVDRSIADLIAFPLLTTKRVRRA